MRDFSFVLTGQGRAVPPFAYELAAARATERERWAIRDGLGFRVGHAPTRAGARAAVVALYATKRACAA